MNKEQKKMILNTIKGYYETYKKKELISLIPEEKEIYISRLKSNVAIVKVDSLNDTFICAFRPDIENACECLLVIKDDEPVATAIKLDDNNIKYKIIIDVETILKSDRKTYCM